MSIAWHPVNSSNSDGYLVYNFKSTETPAVAKIIRYEPRVARIGIFGFEDTILPETGMDLIYVPGDKNLHGAFATGDGVTFLPYADGEFDQILLDVNDYFTMGSTGICKGFLHSDPTRPCGVPFSTIVLDNDPIICDY